MAQRTRQASLPGMDDSEVAGAAATVTSSLSSPASAAIEDGGAADNPKSEIRNLKSPKSSVSELAGKTVYAIDANSLIYQVFHAIPEMTSPTGEPVNAV